MTRLPLHVSDEASRELRAAQDWWRANRPAAPAALVEDVRRALELIRTHPGIGARASNTQSAGIRRVRLGRVRYDLYYRLSPSGQSVEVLAFWHSSRGGSPAV